MALHGNIMATAWQPHGNMHGRVHDKRMATAWQLHGNIMATAWQQHGNCAATAWHHHGNIMATAWQLHGNIMAACQPSFGPPFQCAVRGAPLLQCAVRGGLTTCHEEVDEEVTMARPSVVVDGSAGAAKKLGTGQEEESSPGAITGPGPAGGGAVSKEEAQEAGEAGRQGGGSAGGPCGDCAKTEGCGAAALSWSGGY